MVEISKDRMMDILSTPKTLLTTRFSVNNLVKPKTKSPIARIIHKAKRIRDSVFIFSLFPIIGETEADKDERRVHHSLLPASPIFGGSEPGFKQRLVYVAVPF